VGPGYSTGEQRRVLTGHTGEVNGVAFSPDGRLLASGGNKPFKADGGTDNADVARELVQLFRPPTPVRLWDPATGEQRRVLTGHTGTVNGVAFSPDGRLLASCSIDKTVWLWDPATGGNRRILIGHTGAALGVAFSPDGRLLASCSGDKTVRSWDPATGEHRWTLNGRSGFWGVAFSPDGRLLASGNDEGMVRLWELYPGR
jgi:WD40 repeat protein